ncbi:LysR family transcriptional regulator [Pigmentiphaga litoralis]|uniref:LysR family transcriptional regulator n=1 Tax=Pigmentiphaga litoralis TaxID=516702 RepID=UPI001677BFCF|nr:LysR family transcriptional regulator [Pigmentiphaga litoralis]GGX03283.1 LysR family transcriptional regulator [Pigmentiphaga litoralis]
MNVSARQLRCFLTLARLRSFTRAAEQLHITQAGLSAMMRDLETQFGCRLFDRTTRVVALTPEGAQLVPSAERMLAELNYAALRMGNTAAAARRQLSVAVSPVVASSFFPEACEDFASRYPDVTVKLHDVNKEQMPAMLESGEVDVGFGSFLNPAAGIDRVALFNCHLLCVAQPGRMTLTHRAGDALPRTRWKQLPDLPILAAPATDTTQILIDAQLAQIGRAHEERPTYHSMQLIIAMAARGFGIGIVPSFALPVALRFGVEVARLQAPLVDLAFYRIVRKGRELPPTIEPFVQSVVKTAKTMCAL